MKKRNIFRAIWFSFVTLFCIWQCSTYQSRGLPENTFDNNNKVTVEKSDDKITFISKNSIQKNQIIFFQGGLTDPKAYAPLCRQIAENGFTCHLIKMDWRMPQWDYSKIKKMFDLKNGNYIIGGHSQGAKIASQFVYENQNLMKGLFLLGTSHPRDFDLSNRTVPSIKLYAEFDGLASVAEVMENRVKLPKNAELIEIAGGNHSQFGYLGKLLTDDTPEISLAEQQGFTLKILTDFFKSIAKDE
jgi:pimeloyl-ACP methyl ester carboxylesterase